MISTIIILLVACIVPDVYLWLCFVRGCAWPLCVLHWVPLAALIAVMALAATGHMQDTAFKFIIFIAVCLILPKLIFMVVSLIGRAAGLVIPTAVSAGNALAAAVALVVLCCSAYGYIAGWKHLVVRNVDVTQPSIPKAFDGYRIIHLSDLHLGTYASSPATVRQIVDSVNALNADLVVFTGDIVNGHPSELEPFVSVLSQIKARDGVLSVLGNHDYCMYHRYTAPDNQADAVRRLVSLERSMGWRLLLNEHVMIHRGADNLAIVGVENVSRPPFPNRGDLKRAMRGVGGVYTVVLTHDPTHWRAEVLPSTSAQLTLSGHTHAMQLRIGRFSPSMWVYKEWGGVYDESGRILNVSTGTGGNVPFRFGAWPEIDVVTLHRSL